ncbi:MAG: ribonuclease T2 [Rhodobacteraceae bacterium]|jgi:ribonuclease T2|uniref:ribonuclease T2 n=1 Tax=Albidovulum sp. TaxID=1872424 RepID=UPI001DA5EF36|nr:ribonuclease T2 [uncultured Defluviimonas sp.]MCB2125284.1 ribonuclease T2 [Paracoccaceae bacterium]MCC0069274.1 ribonuclease T2 [Paracoccaceae bacterium]
MRALALLLLSALPASAEGERAGVFDYYVLSLSWSPTFCALDGDARGEDQCDPRHDFGFTLHGLWPQYEFGWPSYCRTGARDATRAETRAMADIMGSAGLAWYEWKKHGRCSGLSAADYFETSRQAYEGIVIPDVFRALRQDVTLPASVVEEAFVEANPGLDAAMITITCDAGRIEEARICLTKELAPRPCGLDAARDCRMRDALMEAVR